MLGREGHSISFRMPLHGVGRLLCGLLLGVDGGQYGQGTQEETLLSLSGSEM